MKIELPALSLVALVGVSGSGKSSFARAHFRPTEVLSSDACRGMVADDENDQTVTRAAFDTLYYIAAQRLRAGRLTVVDATNVQVEARKPILDLARQHDVWAVAIVLNLPEKLCQERNRQRADRNFGPHVIRQQSQQLHRSLRSLKREGFRQVWTISSLEELDSVQIERVPLWTDRRGERGPFDIIGDVHGCFDELVELLLKMGYQMDAQGSGIPNFRPPDGRRAIFLGDLVDRGPHSPRVLRLAMEMVRAGSALCVPGNHDVRLLKRLRGQQVSLTHGLAETMEQLSSESEFFLEEVRDFLDSLVSHLVLDEGRLVVAHAGMKEAYQGRSSGRVRDFALYGETTGETDEYQLPVRYEWAADYRGLAQVVYGHTPVSRPKWLNRTLCIDTGCVFGGQLTALRYPEGELVSVTAARQYWTPMKPINQPGVEADRADVLDITDVLGKRVIATGLRGNVTVREENAAAALEVMSRFACDPRWLIYLPPTMSPSETHQMGDVLEHPAEAFAYFRKNHVPEVICQEKHMGSRAVVVICRDESAARERFGIADGSLGCVTSRTGRAFFQDQFLERQVLERIGGSLTQADFWRRFQTGWFCLDVELLPWSAKAQELLATQYAPVGVAAVSSLAEVRRALEQAGNRQVEVGQLLAQFTAREECARLYQAAYRRYCWPVKGVNDLKIAPFHLLASEGMVHTHQTHQWHMDTLGELCDTDPNFWKRTATRLVRVEDEASCAAGAAWWEELTVAGGEGMVVKPMNWIVRGPKGMVQPAIKCRGREYLRIIYGPEYTLPESLERLRSRSLSEKRSLALREFALGLEGLQRFVDKEPLYRVHECVFAVLALESEPVDPRL